MFLFSQKKEEVIKYYDIESHYVPVSKKKKKNKNTEYEVREKRKLFNAKKKKQKESKFHYCYDYYYPSCSQTQKKKVLTPVQVILPKKKKTLASLLFSCWSHKKLSTEKTQYHCYILQNNNEDRTPNEPPRPPMAQNQQNPDAPNNEGVGFSSNDLNELDPDGYLLDSQVNCGIAGFIPFAVQEGPYNRIALLNSLYINSINDSSIIIDANDQLQVFPINPDIIIFPWNDSQIHWMVFIINCRERRATFYDPVGNDKITAHKLCMIMRIMEKIGKELFNQTIHCVIADNSTYNIQIDGIRCGVHVIRISEEEAFTGRSIRLPNFNIEAEYQRYWRQFEIMHQIKTNVPYWPPRLSTLNRYVQPIAQITASPVIPAARVQPQPLQKAFLQPGVPIQKLPPKLSSKTPIVQVPLIPSTQTSTAASRKQKSRANKTEEEKEEKKRKDRERKQKAKEAKCSKEIEEYNKKQNEARKLQRESMTADEQAEYNKKEKEARELQRKTMTPEEQEEYNKKEKEVRELQRKTMTPEEQEEYNKKEKEVRELQRKTMTPEEQEEYNKKEKEVRELQRKTMTPEEQEEYNKKEKEARELQRKTMTPEEQEEYNKKEKEARELQRKTMTPEEQEEYNKKEKEARDQQRKTMTADEQASYKKKDKEARASQRNNLTEEEAEKIKKREATLRKINRQKQKEIDEQALLEKNLKKIMNIFNDIDLQNNPNLFEQIKQFKLLTDNQYENLRKYYSRTQQKNGENFSVDMMKRFNNLKKVQKELHRIQKVNELFSQLMNKVEDKDIVTEKMKKFVELGFLLQIRESEPPADEEKALIQIAQIKNKTKKIQVMKENGFKKLGRAKAALLQQLNADIIKVAEKNPEDFLIRQVQRVLIHVGDGRETLNEVYPRAYAKTFAKTPVPEANVSYVNLEPIINDLLGENEEKSQDDLLEDDKNKANLLKQNPSNDNKINNQNLINEEPTNFMDHLSPSIITEKLSENTSTEKPDSKILNEKDLKTVDQEQEIKEQEKDNNQPDTIYKNSKTCISVELTNRQKEMNKVVFDEILFNDELKKNAGKIAHKLLPHTTMARECDDDECPKLNYETAKIIQDCLTTLAQTKNEELEDALEYILSDKKDSINNKTVMECLREFAPHSTGIRSILRRYVEIFTYFAFITRIENAYKSCNYEELNNITNYKNVPREIMYDTSKSFYDTIDKLTQEYALTQHGKLIQKFEKQITLNETESCDICDQLFLEKDVSKIKYTNELLQEKFQPYLLEETYKEFIQNPTKELKVCKTCNSAIKGGNIPLGAVVNGFQIEEISELGKKLNWLEKALCQLFRPVQSTFQMKDILGKRTQLKGKQGALVLLPVPTENTITHLVNTLPSSESLTIIVKTTVGKPLVRLPLVLKYLKELKENHDFYKHITINEEFTFDKDENLIFDKPPTEEQIKNLVQTKNNPHELTRNLKEEPDEDNLDIEIQPMVDIDNDGPSKTAFEQYVLIKNPNEPINLGTEKNVDVRTFHDLYPSGKYGMHDKRSRTVTDRMYVRNKLRNKNRRFASNAKYLTINQGIFEINDIKSSIATRTRIGKNKLLASELKNALNSGEEQLQQCMATQFAALRGHKGYWEKVRLRLRAMIAMFGAPTWFLTLNPAELDWKEIHDVYSKIYGENVTSSNIRTYIALDPYHWCRYFQRRVKAFFKDVLLVDDGPLGKILHHFYRIEYQQRGTEHIHCLLWAENAPKPGDDEEKIVNYIDNYATAREPDPIKEDILHDYVIKYQKHFENHSPTCKRTINVDGQLITTCRFDFPRDENGVTIINRTATDSMTIVNGKSKYYSLKRRKGVEQWINDYNPSILMAWKANIDLQFLSKDTMHIVNYVSGYATKGESSKSECLLDSLKDSNISNYQRFKVYIDILKRRKMGLLEIVDLLMGHHMFEFSCGEVFINSNADDKRYRILKPKDKLPADDADQTYLDNWMDTYYSKRLNYFEGFSLFNLIINYQVKNTKKAVNTDIEMKDESVKTSISQESYHTCIEPSDQEDNSVNTAIEFYDEEGEINIDELQKNENNDGEEVNEEVASASNNPFKHYYHITDKLSPFFYHPNSEKSYRINNCPNKLMVKRKAVCPRLYWPKLEANNEKSREDYFRRLCMLFIPWREENTLMRDFETFEEKWINFMDILKKKSEGAYEDIQKVIKNQTAQLEMEREIYEAKRLLREALVKEKVDLEPEDALEVYDRQVDKEQHEKNIQALNTEQSEIMKWLFDHLEAQRQDPTIKPIQAFISGTAGTGKSFLINTSADQGFISYGTEENNTTKPPVLIAAPTGLAAIQIKGSTLHSLFHINVQHGRNEKLSSLTPEQLNLKRLQFQNIKFLIIDEISMVSNIMLAKIHYRLTQFMCNNEPFGGINILAFGDLLQLPPVKESHIFQPLKQHQIKKVFGSCIEDFTFWSLFEYRELQTNMRQKDSKDFAELLGRMRIQQMKDADHEILRKKIIPGTDDKDATMEEIAQKYVEIYQQKDPKVMALFSLQAEVIEFNMVAIQKLGLNAIVIEAEDTEKRSKKRKENSKIRERIYQKNEYPRIDGKTRQNNRITKKDKDDQRAAGGMAKIIHLAVGGRVILRRNINARIGLVNGATGILTKIHYFNDIPQTLEIKFDNISQPQMIEKVSVIFDIGPEDQICRRQFPVTMAFAATIHKCQGLTLNNVIVSLGTVFTGGQAFVACSRVTSLEGLWFADYDPDKFKVVISSLEEYNRLRKTRGLSQIAMPSKETKKQQPIKANPRKRKLPATNNISLLVVPQPDAKKPKKQTKAQIPAKIKKPKNDNTMDWEPVQLRDLNDQPLLLLRNYGSDCFLIATVNFLHRITPLVQWLVANGPNSQNQIINELSRIYNNSNTDIRNLRQLLNTPTFIDLREEHRDVTDAVDQLYHHFENNNINAINCFQVRWQINRDCPCNLAPRLQQQSYISYLLNSLGIPTNIMSLSFTQFLEYWAHQERNCGDHRQNRNKVLQDPNDPHLQYIIIMVDGYLNNGRDTRKLRVREMVNVRMFDFNWNLISAIERRPAHYATWVKARNEDGWIILDDNRLDHRRSILTYITDYRMLLYRKRE